MGQRIWFEPNELGETTWANVDGPNPMGQLVRVELYRWSQMSWVKPLGSTQTDQIVRIKPFEST